VYKIPLNIPATCPNRDGTKGTGGCIFCGSKGAGFELKESTVPLREQIKINTGYIGQKYKVDKFIAYLQNFTPTYMPIQRFEVYVNEIIDEMVGLVAIYISTRPDCIDDEYLRFLNTIKEKHCIDIIVELGLQTSNEKTLEKLNRGHDVFCFIDAVERLHAQGFEVCAHVITDIPYDTKEDTIKTAELIKSLEISQIKCHSLYIPKDTVLAKYYADKKFEPVTYEEYLERIVAFIRHSSHQAVFQRIIGRAPEKDTLFCNWGKSWWKIRDDILEIMETNNFYQGSF
jgi:uncharacterized protein